MNINALFDGVWAIRESALIALVEAARAMTEPPQARSEAAIGHASRRSGSIAVVPITGPISQKHSIFHEFFGGTSTEGLEVAVQGAANDPNVKAIVLDIDSPGGSVYGVEQAADTIRSARGSKPIVAIANSQAASAAYWLGSQADELYLAPGAEVGSIGVFSMHVDLSEALKQEGVKVSFVSAGKYKTEGNPYEPLSDEARADIQRSVNGYYADFLKGVAAGRGTSPATVREKYGEGRMFGGQEALDRGMADRIGTMADLLGRLGANKAAAKRSADILRRRLQLRKANG